LSPAVQYVVSNSEDPMKAELKVELSPRQQELILRGLRFVKSSVALDMVDYSTSVEDNRRRQYAEIDELKDLLEGVESRSAATV
jgi:hypothetical protein